MGSRPPWSKVSEIAGRTCTFEYTAPDGCRFGPDAVRGWVGKLFGTDVEIIGRITEASVVRDGAGVRVTIHRA